MCVTFPGDRLREGTLGGPGNGGSSGHWDSRAHSADLRRGAHEGHFQRQLGSWEVGEYIRGRLGGDSRVVLL